MTRSQCFLASLPAVFVLAAAPSARADFNCTGAAGAGPYQNVVVPQGATCTLNGTTVNGNVTVNTGANLIVQGAHISNDVQANTARSIRIDCGAPGCPAGSQTTIGGNLQITKTTGVPAGFPANYICNGTKLYHDLQLNQNAAPFEVGGPTICSFGGNVIGGNVQATNNSGSVDVSDNTIRNDLQADNNTGGFNVTGNRVGGNLDCQNNSAPITGEGNTAKSKQAQCSGF